MSGLILSHLISTYLIGILLVIICLINIKRFFQEKKRIGYLCLAAGFTFLLTSFYLLPMIEQMLDGTFMFNSLDQTSKLLERSLPIWSIFIEFPSHILMENWIPTGLGLGFLFIIYYFVKKHKNLSSFTKTCFCLALIILLCSTNLFPWNLFQGILSPIQFPWRFYFVVILLLSIGSGLLFNESKIDLNKLFRPLFIIFLIPVLVVGILNFFAISKS